MAKKRKIKTMKTTNKSTWTNESKEQLSLEQGSEAYAEYEEDLQEVNPFRPDDAFHAELEERNALHDDRLAIKAMEAQNSQYSGSQIMAKGRQRREDAIVRVGRQMRKEAMATEATDDNIRAAKIQADSDAIEAAIEYNTGAGEEEIGAMLHSKYF